jgi:hypothetical protein
MHEEGWYVDPFGHHEARWISDGTPTGLVRDGRDESQDPPPEAPFSGTLQPLADASRSDSSDLRRADRDDSEMPSPAEQTRKLFDLLDQVGRPFSN